ncbi:MAG: hypothetical protein ABW022_07230 [Actinoplanes sp.]
MRDIKGAARSAMAAQLISGLIADHAKPLKADLLSQMTDVGAERVRVHDDDGTDLGALSIGCKKPAAKVTDERAFTSWVAERYPNELVQAVRDSFAKKLLDVASAAGEPVDAVTGEVIPGVEIVAGEPYLTVRPTADAKARMHQTLQASGLLQLRGGDPA